MTHGLRDLFRDPTVVAPGDDGGDVGVGRTERGLREETRGFERGRSAQRVGGRRDDGWHGRY